MVHHEPENYQPIEGVQHTCQFTGIQLFSLGTFEQQHWGNIHVNGVPRISWRKFKEPWRQKATNCAFVALNHTSLLKSVKLILETISLAHCLKPVLEMGRQCEKVATMPRRLLDLDQKFHFYSKRKTHPHCLGLFHVPPPPFHPQVISIESLLIKNRKSPCWVPLYHFHRTRAPPSPLLLSLVKICLWADQLF